LAKHSSNVACE